MASEVVETVLEKERQAQQEIENARQKAEGILIAEKKKARSNYERIIKEAEDEVLLMIKESRRRNN